MYLTVLNNTCNYVKKWPSYKIIINKYAEILMFTSQFLYKGFLLADA